MKHVFNEWKTIEIIQAPLKRFLLQNLLPFTEHRFRVRAHGHGWSKYSRPSVWARTLPAKPPPPDAPTLVERSHSLLSVKWEHHPEPTDSGISNGSSITAYQLEYRVGRDIHWGVIMEDLRMSREQ